MNKFPTEKGANIHDAIANIHPEVLIIKGSTLEDIVCMDSALPPNVLDIDLNSTAIQDEIKRLDDGWDSEEYSRKRINEYPTWQEQLNKIYDDGLTKWKSEMVDPIKAKYPKP